MPIFQSHTGFNITGEKLQLVEIDYRDEKFYLENVDEEFFGDFLTFTEKETKFNSILQESFNELILRKPLKNNLVSFSLPHNFFKIVDLVYDKSMIRADLQEHFKWELSILYPHLTEEDYIIQFIEIENSPFRKEGNVIVIAAMKKLLKSIHKFCVRNGLRLKYVDYSHIASNSLLRVNNPIDADKLIHSIYITDDMVSSILLYKNSPIFFERQNIKNIADVTGAMELIFGKLADMNISSDKISKCYISGSSISNSLIDNLNQHFKQIFDRLNPFENIPASAGLEESKLYTHKFNSFSAASGIALRLI